MAPKNIDETIQKLLNGYAQWCKTVLDKQLKEIQTKKFYTEEDRTNAVQEHTRAKQAYEYLLKIVKDPKKYLYTEKDVIYSDVIDYNKLAPMLDNRFDKSQKHLFVRLSEAIAHHVKYGRNDHNGVWVYYGNAGMIDLEAEKILKMNKTVQLWNANNLVAAIKDIAPASVFAVDFEYNNKR